MIGISKNWAMNNKAHVTYVSSVKASFVLQDIEWLSERFYIESYFLLLESKAHLPWKLLKLFFDLLLHSKGNILVSFGGYHSFVAALVAKMKGTKCFIILNGTDSTSIPEFRYGHLRKGILRWFCLQSYKMCDRLLPVSQSLIETTNDYAFDTARKLGLKASFSNHKFDYQVIPNGFDLDFWNEAADLRTAQISFVTVVGSVDRVFHKGLDIILEVAPRFPQFQFKVVGLDSLDGSPANVVFKGFLNREELRREYQSSHFYFQLSVWEGFGCALCEAMLCGCTPIVSAVNMLPQIAGHDQLVLKNRSTEELVALIHEVTEGIPSYAARELVVSRFGMETRLSQLSNVLKT